MADVLRGVFHGPITAPDGATLFEWSELADRSGMVGAGWLDGRFADGLRKLRLEFGRPILVNSCCRSEAHNATIGGAANSMHIFDKPAYAALGQLGTMAVDVRKPANDPHYVDELAAVARGLGWSIGWERGCLHLDFRTALDLPRVDFNWPPP